MSNILIALEKAEDPVAWLEMISRAGLSYETFDAIPSIIKVLDTTPESFPLRDRSGIRAIDADDTPLRANEDQIITIGADLSGGSWALPRLIRRKPPWPVRSLKFPWTTFFRCARDGEGVDCYIFDSGIRTTHNEFGGRATNRYEAVSSGGLGDDQGHGTSVSSVACGSTVGIARAALIQSYKCLDINNTGTVGWVVDCINQALTLYLSRNRPAVMNFSLSFISASSTLDAAIDTLLDAGAVVVASAGNDRLDLGTVIYIPAESDPDVIVAGGIGPADIPYYAGALGTNWGSRIDVSAPAQSVWAAGRLSNTDYRLVFGTSFAAPCVTGLIACLLTGRPRLTTRSQVQAIRSFVMSSATTGRLRSSGFGITIPDRIAYINPDVLTETIPGL